MQPEASQSADNVCCCTYVGQALHLLPTCCDTAGPMPQMDEIMKSTGMSVIVYDWTQVARADTLSAARAAVPGATNTLPLPESPEDMV